MGDSDIWQRTIGIEEWETELEKTEDWNMGKEGE